MNHYDVRSILCTCIVNDEYILSLCVNRPVLSAMDCFLSDLRSTLLLHVMK